jgi:hypothetical protein
MISGGGPATLLNNGTVLFTGGNPSGSGELYNPALTTFSDTGSMTSPRSASTATLLSNGMILVVGGHNVNGDPAPALLYNPATGVFTPTGNLITPRSAHTATKLNNGKVLIAGGYSSSTGTDVGSAELYDPATGNFTGSAGGLNTARRYHTATLLNNGMVLIAAGTSNAYGVLGSAELYNPVSGTFTPTANLNSARVSHTATLLNSGSVLIAGGSSGSVVVATAEVYDPNAGIFTPTGNLSSPRQSHTATLLTSGLVLLAGGQDNTGTTLASAELYKPATLTPAGLASIAITPANASVGLGVSQPFVATGTFSGTGTQILSSVTWSSQDPTVSVITNDASNSGTAEVVGLGATTITACAGSVCGSTAITVGVVPTIVSISSLGAPAGTLLTINGTNFGSSQGTVMFGSSPAVIQTWNANFIVVQIPYSLMPGLTNVQVITSGGASSNTAMFMVTVPGCPSN